MNFSTRSVARDGFHLHYRVYGCGSPLAILAGGPGLDCDYLEPMAREFAKSHQAILIELRGTGRSLPQQINRETITVRATIADIDTIREQIGAERWIVAGHSAGAVLGVVYAIQYSQRVASLVLMSSGPIRYASAAIEMENIMKRLTEQERSAFDNAPHEDFGRILEIILPGYFYDRSKMAEIAPQLSPEKYHVEAARLLGAGILPPNTDLRPALKDFSQPVLVIAGREDPLDATVQNEIHSALENSTLRLLENCGHFPWIEQPDEFYRSVRAFLAANH